MRAPKKITALPTVSTIKNVDWFALVQDGVTSKVTFDDLNKAIGDEWVTGGTYNPSTGCGTFSTNSGHTFVVCGFLTGYTDAYTTGATLNSTVIEFGNTLFGDNFYSVDIGGLIFSGGTFTGNTSGTCISDLFISNLHGCTPVTVHDNLQHLGTSAIGHRSISWGSGTQAAGAYSHAGGKGYVTTVPIPPTSSGTTVFFGGLYGDIPTSSGDTLYFGGGFSGSPGNYTSFVGKSDGTPGNFTDISITSTTGDMLTAIKIRKRDNPNLVVANIADNGPYWSDDGGTNWTPALIPPDSSWVYSATGGDTIGLEVDKDGTGLDVWTIGDGGGTYYSSDGGKNYIQQTSLPTPGGVEYGNSIGYYLHYGKDTGKLYALTTGGGNSSPFSATTFIASTSNPRSSSPTWTMLPGFSGLTYTGSTGCNSPVAGCRSWSNSIVEESASNIVVIRYILDDGLNNVLTHSADTGVYMSYDGGDTFSMSPNSEMVIPLGLTNYYKLYAFGFSEEIKQLNDIGPPVVWNDQRGPTGTWSGTPITNQMVFTSASKGYFNDFDTTNNTWALYSTNDGGVSSQFLLSGSSYGNYGYGQGQLLDAVGTPSTATTSTVLINKSDGTPGNITPINLITEDTGGISKIVTLKEDSATDLFFTTVIGSDINPHWSDDAGVNWISSTGNTSSGWAFSGSAYDWSTGFNGLAIDKSAGLDVWLSGVKGMTWYSSDGGKNFIQQTSFPYSGTGIPMSEGQGIGLYYGKYSSDLYALTHQEGGTFLSKTSNPTDPAPTWTYLNGAAALFWTGTTLPGITAGTITTDVVEASATELVISQMVISGTPGVDSIILPGGTGARASYDSGTTFDIIRPTSFMEIPWGLNGRNDIYMFGGGGEIKHLSSIGPPLTWTTQSTYNASSDTILDMVFTSPLDGYSYEVAGNDVDPWESSFSATSWSLYNTTDGGVSKDFLLSGSTDGYENSFTLLTQIDAVNTATSSGSSSSVAFIYASGQTSFIHYHKTGPPSMVQYMGAFGDYSAILGGSDHHVHAGGTSSGIFAGSGNTISPGIEKSVVLGGDNITAIESETAYVPQLNIKTLGSSPSVTNLGRDASGNVVAGTSGGGTFTGNTSGDCINDIHVKNIHACSDLTINNADEGNVTFGSTGGVSISVTGESVTATDLHVGEFIYHKDDPDTNIRFTPDRIRVKAGATEYICIQDDPPGAPTGEIVFNEGDAQIITRIEGVNNENLFFVNGLSGYDSIGINSSGRTDVILHVSGDTRFDGEILVDRGNKGLFYTDLNNVSGPLIRVSGASTDLVQIGTTIPPSAGFGIGSIGYDTGTSFDGYGKPGDGFLYSSNAQNGLNIISASGINTEDYIRFYTGQDADDGICDMFIAGSGLTRGFVGIATESPEEKLHVEGSIKMVDGNEQSGYVLTSNASGVGSWQPSSGAGTFTGNTSATCIDTLWVSTISGCSPVTIGSELKIKTNDNTISTDAFSITNSDGHKLLSMTNKGDGTGGLIVNNMATNNLGGTVHFGSANDYGFISMYATGADQSIYSIPPNLSGQDMSRISFRVDDQQGFNLYPQKNVYDGLNDRTAIEIPLINSGAFPTGLDFITSGEHNPGFKVGPFIRFYSWEGEMGRPNTNIERLRINHGSGSADTRANISMINSWVGINTLTPDTGTTLHVSGKTKTINFQMTSGPTAGYVLTSDVSGNASWQPSSGAGGTFTGNTSATCIDTLWVSTISGCSPVTIGRSIQSSTATASGINSMSYGFETVASGEYSHAEGKSTSATGSTAHAEGEDTMAYGEDSHAEGKGTTASGGQSHAEGGVTQAIGGASHAEGAGTIAFGDASHSEGEETQAIGKGSHAEGFLTVASGDYSHAGGSGYEVSGASIVVSGRSAFAHFEQTESPILPGLPNAGTLGDNTAIIGGTNHWIGGGDFITGTVTTGSTGSVILGGDRSLIMNSVYAGMIGNFRGMILNSVLSFIIGGTETYILNHVTGATTTPGPGITATTQHHIGANSIFGGDGNTIGNGKNSTIVGGSGNSISGQTGSLYDSPFKFCDGSIIAGGVGNEIQGARGAATLGGGAWSGGLYNSIGASADNSVILGGTNIRATSPNTAYVPNLNIGTVGSGTSVTNIGIDSAGNVTSGITEHNDFFIKRTLVKSEILALTGTPIELISAPGPGKIILPHQIHILYKFSGTGYTADGGFNSMSIGQSGFTWMTVFNSNFEKLEDWLMTDNSIGGNGAAMYNQPLRVSSSGDGLSDPDGMANGTIQIDVHYGIMDSN